MRKYDKENQSNMFKKYYADVEYNRMRNGDIKQYEDSRKVKQKMVSDLLIQSRGIERNLLAVELKKTKNKDQRDENRDRLKSIVKPSGNEDCVHGTLVGAFIIYSPEEVVIEIYENRDGHGKKTDEDLNFRYDEMLRELVRI
jgi:hypothetical protein